MIWGLLVAFVIWLAIAVWAAKRDERLHTPPDTIWTTLYKVFAELQTNIIEVGKAFERLSIPMQEAQESFSAFVKVYSKLIEQENSE